MNKPAYAAINTHSPTKPVLIFVSSRRQTRLTALDLITYCVADECPKQWLNMPEEEMEEILSGIQDPNLQHTLAFGIGLHHAGLKVTHVFFFGGTHVLPPLLTFFASRAVTFFRSFCGVVISTDGGVRTKIEQL